jgi:hypothetical protein
MEEQIKEPEKIKLVQQEEKPMPINWDGIKRAIYFFCIAAFIILGISLFMLNGVIHKYKECKLLLGSNETNYQTYMGVESCCINNGVVPIGKYCCYPMDKIKKNNWNYQYLLNLCQ